MKSPFTGKEMERVYEKRMWNFRGEQYEYIHSAWRCVDTGEEFTEDADDTAAFVQVTNKYRNKYGIPYKDQIIDIRKLYDISAAKMSLILGMGANQYRLYEIGEVPSISNGRLILAIMKPEVMLSMIESAMNVLSKSEYEKILEKTYKVIKTYPNKAEEYDTSRVFTVPRGEENGYAKQSLVHLKNIMLYILDHCSNVWYTKMNKLLFYADFLSYREYGMAMPGLSYRAINYGPVPEKWERVYSEFQEINQDLSKAGNYTGYILTSSEKPNLSVISEEERQILDVVCTKFGQSTSKKLSESSHCENAWLLHHENHERIPFEDAFQLTAI